MNQANEPEIHIQVFEITKQERKEFKTILQLDDLCSDDDLEYEVHKVAKRLKYLAFQNTNISPEINEESKYDGMKTQVLEPNFILEDEELFLKRALEGTLPIETKIDGEIELHEYENKSFFRLLPTTKKITLTLPITIKAERVGEYKNYIILVPN
jgi:hypothetical protein